MHVTTHWLSLHAHTPPPVSGGFMAPHTLPHAPQFCVSARRSRHAPLHTASLVPHAHAPEAQLAPVAHALPHAPQLPMSVERSTHDVPPHIEHTSIGVDASCGVPVSGGPVSGVLTVSSPPSSRAHPATRQTETNRLMPMNELMMVPKVSATRRGSHGAAHTCFLELLQGCEDSPCRSESS